VELQNKYRDQGLQIIGISLDDDAKSVRAFYQQFKMKHPVAVGDAGLGAHYGGILGLPVSFVIGCDGRIYARHSGEIAISIIEPEVKPFAERRTMHEVKRRNVSLKELSEMQSIVVIINNASYGNECAPARLS